MSIKVLKPLVALGTNMPGLSPAAPRPHSVPVAATESVSNNASSQPTTAVNNDTTRTVARTFDGSKTVSRTTSSSPSRKRSAESATTTDAPLNPTKGAENKAPSPSTSAQPSSKKANVKKTAASKSTAPKKKKRSSKYRGVTWNKWHQKWTGQIRYGGKQHHLGVFVDPIDAALAYDAAATEHHGAKAVLNFPVDPALSHLHQKAQTEAGARTTGAPTYGLQLQAAQPFTQLGLQQYLLSQARAMQHPMMLGLQTVGAQQMAPGQHPQMLPFQPTMAMQQYLMHQAMLPKTYPYMQSPMAQPHANNTNSPQKYLAQAQYMRQHKEQQQQQLRQVQQWQLQQLQRQQHQQHQQHQHQQHQQYATMYRSVQQS